ncbi:unnamed protein product, partial [marine sediment metagenome]
FISYQPTNFFAVEPKLKTVYEVLGLKFRSAPN